MFKISTKLISTLKSFKSLSSLHASPLGPLWGVALTLLILIQACSSAPEIEVPEDIAAMENVAVFFRSGGTAI